MNSKQKSIFWSINLFAFVFLMYFITQVTKAYIAADYPEISGMMVDSLLTIPNLVDLVFSFLIGPIALRHSKVRLAAVSMFCVIIYCAIFYITGRLHLPFGMFVAGCFFAGCSQGTYAPLLNSIIADHFPAEQRGNRIANYNVAINVGAVIILQLSGIVAAADGGARWYNAYLLGIATAVGLCIFLLLAKRADADVPSMAAAGENSGADHASAPKIRDIPKNVLGFVILMGVIHCLFYIGQYAFNINASTYIISEYELGSAVEAGTATSLVRFSLVIFTALYPLLNQLLKDWMIPVGYLCVGIGLIIMMRAESLMGAYTCACFIGLATSLAHSSLYAKASRFVPVALVPVAMSLVWGVANIGSSFAVQALEGIAAIFGGGMSNNFLAGIIVSVIAAVVAVYMYVIKKPVQNVD